MNLRTPLILTSLLGIFLTIVSAQTGQTVGSAQAAAYWNESSEAYAKGDYPKTIAVLQKLLKMEPLLAIAHYRLSSAYFLSSQFPEAVSSLKRVIELDPYFVDARISLASVYLKINDPTAAIKELEEAWRIKPGQPNLRQHLANAYQRAGRDDEAAKILNSVVPPAGALQYFIQGRDFLRTLDLEKAAAAFAQAIAIDPLYTDAYNSLAIVNDNLHRYSENVAILNQLIGLKAADYSSYAVLGSAYAHLDKLKEAELAYLHSIELKKDNPFAYRNLAVIYSNLGEFQKSIDANLEVLKGAPEDIQLLAAIARAYSELRQYDKSADMLRRITRITPEDAFAFKNLGYILMAAGNPKEAEEALQTSLRLNPSDQDVKGTLAAARSRLKDSSKLEDFRRAVKNDPNNVEAHLNLASYLYSFGKQSEAAEEYKVAARLRPGDKDTLLSLMIALGEAGKREEELEVAREYAQLLPNSSEGTFRVADALAKLNRNEEAAEEYEKALRFAPDDISCLKGLLLVNLHRRKYADGIEIGLHLIKLKPNDPVSLYNLIQAYLGAGQRDAAIPYFRQLQTQNPVLARQLGQLIEK